MRARKLFTAVDTHTEGMPTRVVTAGFPPLPGRTMLERSHHVATTLDGWRRLLMYEPRGHQAMSGAILTPPIRDDADLGVVYIEVTGCLPMCGHGTIGAVTAAIETGLVDVAEPTTTVRLDTPAGLVVATATVEAGQCRSVTLTNVPAFLAIQDAVLQVSGWGAGGPTQVTVDVAFGGNFYVICPADALGLSIDPGDASSLIAGGRAVMAAANEQLSIVHPAEPAISGTHHVLFTADPTTGAEGLEAAGTVVIDPGYLDRSPCGTGTSARMAQMHARGALGLDQPLVHTSIINSGFTGRLVGETTVGGTAAVIPTITGRAWITALNQLVLDPTDPYPEGFLIA
ncbi:proline racemase family protein [Euzebya tangerina]|uniref:proline racemase family protein n=1 Tax=Euzebya tangerina TaxID=591198 RepID=UPI000E314D74|nr:proline racemase family protein [Euzebya tangerina]